MIVTLDNSAFTLLINPDAGPPIDPNTGIELTHTKERVQGLLDDLGAKDRLIIPAPVLAETLVIAENAAPEVTEKLQTMARILIASFDQRAAIELAMMHREALQATSSKKGTSTEPWQKVKFDRQIIAIARVHRSDAIYSDDKALCDFANSVGMSAQSTWDLPVPEKTPDLFAQD
ncbi:PIN domain-containing protein [Aurantiacibacter rhizosphaerae]|uniref:PIN domain-containing protein n=1 Tax=Aurantiacibacter rhizosphaerae TaxID=2691582 RepID=A0A844XHF0_9SPHN|nr:PIN domain-containing protein [Aurantiacibacter rhizosphaerae]MWV29153.1 PIN domain-containing protein [Aurantiacibacter rhizosphaerae]